MLRASGFAPKHGNLNRCDRNGIQRFRLSAAPQLSTQTGENAANCALSQQAHGNPLDRTLFAWQIT